MRLFPDSWQVCEADTVCAEIVDCVNKTASVVDRDTGYRMIRTTNVRDGRIDLSETRFVEAAVFQKWTRRVVPRRNDIVLTREAPLGEVGLLRSDDKVFLGQRTMLYRADPKKLNQQFLYYSLLGPYVQGQIRGQGSGATVEHLRVPDAEKLAIPVAPLEDQKKIAAILAAYDDLIENNRRRIALLEKMAEEIYREWFVRLRFPGHEQAKFEKGLPERWTAKSLREIVEYYIGGGWGEDTYTSSHCEGAYVIRGTDIPKLSDGDLTAGVFRFHTTSNLKSRRLKSADFVFEVSGGSKDQLLGRNLMLTEKLIEHLGAEVMCASFCKLLRFNATVVSPYLMRFFLKLYYQSGLVGLYQVQSTGISNYQFESFLSYQTVVVPELLVQRAFDAVVKPMLNIRDTLSIENLLLRNARDSLLPRLISGKLPVDSHDIRFPLSMHPE